MAEITISEGLGLLKTYRERHAELVNLRNENSNRQTRHYGVGGDKEVTKEPVYPVKQLDAMITNIAKHIRLLDMAIKQTNATQKLIGYTANEEEAMGSL